MSKSKSKKESEVPYGREEYTPYPAYQRYFIGLPKVRIIDFREDFIDFGFIADYSQSYGLECTVITETYKKQPLLLIMSGKYASRVFIDLRFERHKSEWETLH